MRRIVRAALPTPVLRYLREKQREVDSGEPASKVWEWARQTKSMRSVYEHLLSMAGKRERCMYCQDSRGVDIDHLWPKARYPERTFLWENLILLCSGCNRKKGALFELDTRGSALLIDPTQEDPWDHLFYDSRTGIVTARFLPTGQPDPRGDYTAERSKLPLNIQAVTEGRSKIQRNLERCVKRFFESVGATVDQGALERELLSCVEDNDEFGLGAWFVLRDGRDEPQFVKIRELFPNTWATLEARLTYGTGSGS